MFGKKKLLSRKQINEVCSHFKCHKSEFAVRKFEDGYLIFSKK